MRVEAPPPSTTRASLRGRLTLIILCPLLLFALVIGAASFRDAERRAADAFDRSLLSTALAISRDTAFSGGDALGERSRDLLRDTSGGVVFYHVYAPDGVFVTGYATPPAPPSGARSSDAPQYYNATYFGRNVRVARLHERMRIDGLTGDFTFTVWQELAIRDAAIGREQRRTAALIGGMIAVLAFVVWFGVRLGLRPLLGLEEAIDKRSADDLTPIMRPIPVEVRGVVGRLNRLFGELGATLAAKDAFISDAAHQLRNPIAGVMSLAEAAASARSEADRRERMDDLLDAARRAVRLTEDLLTLERARAGPSNLADVEPIDIAAAVRSAATLLERAAADRDVAVELRTPSGPHLARVDPVMLQQALLNLATNALTHGGAGLTRVSIDLAATPDAIRIRVADDGQGLAPKDYDVALERFGQPAPSNGSGLGLPIARAVADGAGGALRLTMARDAWQGDGLTAVLELPHAASVGGGAPRRCP